MFRKLKTIYGHSGITDSGDTIFPYQNSLILLHQNRNGINFPECKTENLNTIFCDPMAEFFSSIGQRIESRPISNSFIVIWNKKIEDLKENVSKKIKMLFPEMKNNSIAVVIRKIIGNVFEIFIEFIIVNNILPNICTPDSYTPALDPANETYIDAQGENYNGEHEEMQFKNYNTDFNQVSYQTFSNVFTNFTKWLRRQQILNPDFDYTPYLKRPHAHIISTSNADERAVKEYQNELNAINFIGPKEIDALHIQGDSKKNIIGPYEAIYDISNQINDAKIIFQNK